jgi:anti-anti-sigma factor
MSDATLPEESESRLDIDLHEDPQHQCIVAKLKGRLDVFTYRELARRLEEAIGQKNLVRLVVDLSGVGFIASSGWSAFIATRARLKRGGGKMAFVGLNSDIERVYTAMKMPELVPAFSSLDQAVQALAQGGG